jgi:transcriptional regulator with XRE-family HTH domain
MITMGNALDPDRSLWDLIAVEVRRQREQHEFSGSRLADLLGCDRSTVSRIENGLRRLSPGYAAKLDRLWRTELLFTRLVRLAYASDSGHWFASLIEYESLATRIKIWELAVIPGLLQTPDYARAVLSSGLSRNVDQDVEKRLARQAAVFDRPTPPHVFVILNWVVLEQVFGDAAIMRGQLAHLLEMSERPNVSMRVLDKDAGGHIGVNGSFRLLTVDDRDVAYAEAQGRGRLILDASEVQYYALAYDRLADIAAPLGSSRALIERTMETYR